jgi:serine/threonine protein kinase
MKVEWIQCGQPVNASEERAFREIRRGLEILPGKSRVFLLTNFTFSVDNRARAEEIDAVVLTDYGVRLIEVKHWTGSWIKQEKDLVEHEADRALLKAKKLGTTLRRYVPELPYVPAAILLTPPPSKIGELPARSVHGVDFFNLNQVSELLAAGGPPVLKDSQIVALARALSPTGVKMVTGDLQRLAGYVNLVLETPKEERFRRVYRAVHPSRRDRVFLHLYDLTAVEQKAEERARREFEALHRLQRYPWAPRVLDSFQRVPGYDGEMWFFTVIDPGAPSIERRAEDSSWSLESRAKFAERALLALQELHRAEDKGRPMLHRGISPDMVLVTADNQPIFTGFYRAYVSDGESISGTIPPDEYSGPTTAPEVRKLGLAAADTRSDLYSLCASLLCIFTGLSGAEEPLEILNQALAEDPAQRPSPEELIGQLREWTGDSVPAVVLPPVRFWSEGQEVEFQGHKYRIVGQLGFGGMGTTFKVVQLDKQTHEECGVYVAKVGHRADSGHRIVRAYQLVRSHVVRQKGLSTVLEVADRWSADHFTAILSWVDGTPLSEFIGDFSSLARELDEFAPEKLALRWLREMCHALNVLHEHGIIHGDVSPRNLIVSEGQLVLTDYDFATKIGDPIDSPGTTLYCSPSAEQRGPAAPADDLFALAATFFHVIFGREPFFWNGIRDKARGLCWDNLPRDDSPKLAEFLDRATSSDSKQRFLTAKDVLEWLDGGTETRAVREVTPMPQRIKWLDEVLRSYPGSRFGNRETRGLDTTFAEQTYVPTALERALIEDINQGRAKLVILCGNAGDGKTALLQHLAQGLKLGRHRSLARTIGGKIPNGPRVEINLDGSAAYKEKSSDQLLDEFFEPFHDGEPPKGLVRLIAINDGRLLEWLESVEERRSQTALTETLRARLNGEKTDREFPFLRFLSLSERSLVGRISDDGRSIDTGFLNQVVDALYGKEKAAEIWRPCQSCTARQHCEVFRAARLFGPKGVPERVSEDPHLHARKRLFELLQAVHLRGETHITMRELRAALVYVLFGIHSCEDYQQPIKHPIPYWNRAFDPNAAGRQGDVLKEFVRFDPALDSHPQIDRALLHGAELEHGKEIPSFSKQDLASARRWAYFEWLPKWIEAIAGSEDALGLAEGAVLHVFRDFPFLPEGKREEIRRRICQGIARLENLPETAFRRGNSVPLRIPPRTPTETIFWVEKPLERFRLEPDLPDCEYGIERLHRAIWLIYRYQDGREERLRLGAELFARLWELSEGYQLGDISSDDVFTQLSLFVQRLLREDEHAIYAINPMQDEQLYRVSIERVSTEEGILQQLSLEPILEE